jgi:hypothetical protein
MSHLKLIVALAMMAAVLLVVVALSLRRHESLSTTELSATGELVAYEASSHDLTLRTHIGDQHFVVNDGTPIHEGARTLTAAKLTPATHCRVKVWYGDGTVRPVAREVRISCEAPAPAPGR